MPDNAESFLGVSSQPASGGVLPPPQFARSTRFYVGGWLGGRIGSVLLLLLCGIMGSIPQLAVFFFLLAIAAFVFSIVVLYMFFYRMWAALDGHGARTTPAKAVAYIWLPVYNLYWVFQLWWGWAMDFNTLVRKRGLAVRRMSENLAASVPILLCVSLFLLLACPFFQIAENSYSSGGYVYITTLSVSLAAIPILIINLILVPVFMAKANNRVNSILEILAKEKVAAPEATSLNVQTSGLAVCSLVLGILGFVTVGLTGVVGFMLGLASKKAIRRSNGGLKGSGLAATGMAISGASIGLGLILLILLLPLTRVRDEAKAIQFLTSANELGTALLMYSSDNNDILPHTENWPEALVPEYLDRHVLYSPFDTPSKARAFAMNAKMSGQNLDSTSGNTVLAFECAPGSPAAGGPELLPEKPRSRRGYVVLFCDSHVESVKPEELSRLEWEPRR